MSLFRQCRLSGPSAPSTVQVLSRTIGRVMTSRTRLTVALSLLIAFVGALPAAAQDAAAVDTAAVDTVVLSGVIEVRVEPDSSSPYVEMPAHLVGDTPMERFENAWKTDYTSLEAAMIANSIHRESITGNS